MTDGLISRIQDATVQANTLLVTLNSLRSECDEALSGCSITDSRYDQILIASDNVSNAAGAAEAAVDSLNEIGV